MSNEELVLLIKQGKTEYYTPLWEQTEQLIRKITYSIYVCKSIHHTFDFEDLLQCGFFALVLAVKYYDPNKIFKFSTYLSRCVLHEINKLLRQCKDRDNISLDTPLSSEDESLTLADTIENETAAEAFESVELTDTQMIIRRALAYIPCEQSEVLRLFYFADMTRKQIAESLDTTERNIQRLKERGFNSLRRDKSIRALYNEYQTHYFHNSGLCGTIYY